MGIASLVLGILSLVCYGTIAIASLIFALLSIIFGGVAVGTKKKRGLGIAGIIISLIMLFILIRNIDIDNVNTSNNSYTNTLEQSEKVDKSREVYNKNGILIKITNYEYNTITGNLDIDIYIENNTKQDLSFKIDENVTLNDYTVDTYFYEIINKETKSNKTFTLNGLNKNNIKEEDLSIMKFDIDIYHSEDYYIDNRIEDNLQIIYEF